MATASAEPRCRSRPALRPRARGPAQSPTPEGGSGADNAGEEDSRTVAAQQDMAATVITDSLANVGQTCSAGQARSESELAEQRLEAIDLEAHAALAFRALSGSVAERDEEDSFVREYNRRVSTMLENLERYVSDTIFFRTGIFSAVPYLVAVRLANRSSPGTTSRMARTCERRSCLSDCGQSTASGICFRRRRL
jgi:hypothetical protein